MYGIETAFCSKKITANTWIIHRHSKQFSFLNRITSIDCKYFSIEHATNHAHLGVHMQPIEQSIWSNLSFGLMIRKYCLPVLQTQWFYLAHRQSRIALYDTSWRIHMATLYLSSCFGWFCFKSWSEAQWIQDEIVLLKLLFSFTFWKSGKLLDESVSMFYYFFKTLIILYWKWVELICFDISFMRSICLLFSRFQKKLISQSDFSLAQWYTDWSGFLRNESGQHRKLRNVSWK